MVGEEKLEFTALQITHKERMEYLARIDGERSCQHAFSNIFCLQGKYKTEVSFFADMVILRQKMKAYPGKNVYVLPYGAPFLREGVLAVLEEEQGKPFLFRSVTEEKKLELELNFPGIFEFRENRDWAEYLYTYGKLAELKGKEMASKRYDIHTFMRNYGTRFEVEAITKHNLSEIMCYQAEWLAENIDSNADGRQLLMENVAIQIGLAHFWELGLRGILIRIDGKVMAYSYGAPITEDTMDVYIEKGDYRIEDIYRVINQEFVKNCCKEYAYINREEDIGIPGLRKSKMSYKPDILMKKYIAEYKGQKE